MLVTAVALPGCASKPLDDEGDPLTGADDVTTADVGVDVGAPDTGPVDAGPADSGPADSGSGGAVDAEAAQDTGPDLDAGHVDAGPMDAGGNAAVDAGGPVDAGAIVDAAQPVDAGSWVDATTAPDSQADAGAEDVQQDAEPDSAPADTAGPKPPPGKCFNHGHCDDGNACTDDACTKALTCVFVAKAEGAPCEDGLACTVDHVCSGGQCLYNSKKCETKEQCKVAKCDEKAGGCIVVPGNMNGWCDDGNPCTGKDSCKASGKCTGNPTKWGKACVGTKKCSTHVCNNGACVPHKSFTCNDYNQCTFDYCGVGYGNCEHKMKGHGTACDDGIKCTTPDTCQDGTCWGKETKKGCNGLPLNTCADLKCTPAYEDATKCPIDCNPGGLKDWLLFWANCTKEVQVCVLDPKCIEVGNKIVNCKHTKQVGVDWNKFKCMFDVQQKSDKAAFAKYKAVSDCAENFNFKP